MRIVEIISESADASETRGAVIDLLTIMAGEGLDSTSLETLITELSTQGIDIDRNSLFDLLNNLAIVRNIKDDVVFFNTDSDQSHNSDLPDPEKQQKHVSSMAKKQVDKELKKWV